MDVRFVGARGSVFWLSLKTGFWAILTLGFYRFWMKTRLRRYFWSSVRIGGHPLEYTGDPFEKLLGFFIAVVILTFYIGLVNLGLMFLSFSLFEGAGYGYIATGAGVVPLWFYARYRARRYVLGRTRWRGVRFAVEPAAWRYTGQALKHGFITLITLGLLWPRMTFHLEKFRIDRTWFGDLKLEQGGRWQMLYRALYPVIGVLVLTAIWVVWILVLNPMFPLHPEHGFSIEYILDQVFLTESGDQFSTAALNQTGRLWVIPLLVIALLYGIVHYIAASKRILANHKTADGLALTSRLRPRRVVGIYLLGGTLAYLVLVVGLGVVFGLAMAMLGFEAFFTLFNTNAPDVPTVSRWVTIAVSAILYFAVFLMWSVVYNTFITFPLWRHYAQTLHVSGEARLPSVSQRHRDVAAEAEGFSEALDLGAAI